MPSVLTWHRKKEHFESMGSGLLLLGGSRRRGSTDPLSPEHSVLAPNVQRTGANSKPSKPSAQTPMSAVHSRLCKSRKEHFENRQIWIFCSRERPEERGNYPSPLDSQCNYPSPLDSQCRHRVSRGEGYERVNLRKWHG